VISNQGTGASPTICSRVVVRYNGSLIPSGTVFDASSSDVSFLLSQLIVGWQKGLSVLKAGGRITLYVPPTLGYGQANYPPNGPVVIPGGSYLKFDIELVGVQ
jgi:FKBP-type peptidyl-prolyl cis-trans isomerase FkpA